MTMQEEIREVLNRNSRENFSNTPDFILAEYLIACLSAFETASRGREKWYGRELSPARESCGLPHAPGMSCACGCHSR